MIRPTVYPSVKLALRCARYDAYGAVEAYSDAVCELINRQVTRQLCDQLRDLAARIVTASP